jgi:hypothetical protein
MSEFHCRLREAEYRTDVRSTSCQRIVLGSTHSNQEIFMHFTKLLVAIGAAMLLMPGSAFADCNPACPSGQTCRYEAAGGKFYCAPNKTARGPAAVSGPGAAPVAGSPKAVAPSANKVAGKKQSQAKLGNFEIQDVKSPRDPASGLATGRRQHKP